MDTKKIETVLTTVTIDSKVDSGKIDVVVGESAKMDVVKAVNYIQSGKAEIEAGVTEVLNQVDNHVSEKTAEFDQNAQDKTDAFNSNAVDKTGDFDDNYTNKLNAFNQNAQDKTDAFDLNASNKTTDFNDNYVAKKALIDAEVAVAEGYSAEAKQWAIGEPTEPSEGSAKYWAEQASQSVPNNGQLDIQVNGSSIATFTANQATNTTANIVVPDSATWGNITGTLSDQTDLQTALNAKADDSGVVKTTGNQTVAGEKTFTDFVIRKTSIDQSATTGTTEVTTYRVKDTNGNYIAQNIAQRSTTTNTYKTRINNLNSNKWYDIQVILDDDGNGYARTATNGTDKSLSTATSSTSSQWLATMGWVNNSAASTNVVHRSDAETIGGNKTFTSPVKYKNSAMTAGTPPASDTAEIGFGYVDSAGKTLACIQYTYKADGGGNVQLRAYNPANLTQYSNIRIGYDSGGNVFTEAPTPATSDNSTKIATTAFVKAAVSQSTPTVDGVTIDTNSDDELEAIGTVNKNTAVGATAVKYDWIGTLAEYNSQNVETLHPEWICFITDDVSGGTSVYTKAETDTAISNALDNVYTKSAVDTLISGLLANTTSTVTSNYIRLGDWLVHWGISSTMNVPASGSAIQQIALSPAFANSDYTVILSHIFTGSSVGYAGIVPQATSRTPNSFEIYCWGQDGAGVTNIAWIAIGKGA